jgi:hypothetical protein
MRSASGIKALSLSRRVCGAMVVPALFVLTAMLYFYPLLSCRVILTERDLAPFFIPPRLLWVSLAGAFEWPLWNPYNYSGIPLLGTLQPGVFYPPHLFFLFMPFNVVWNWLIILHFAFAGIATYALMRHLKATKEASFVSGIVFMLSGYLLSVHNLLTHLLSVAWFPLVLLFFLRYFESRRIRHLIYSAISLTMLFLAGAPEIVIMTLLVICIITIFLKAFVEAHVPSCAVRLKALAILLVFFAMLSAVQLLPFWELKAFSIRRGGLTYEEATIWSFAWKDFIQFFVPDPFGYFTSEQRSWQNQSWLKTVYLGIVPFALSCFYFLRKEKKQLFFVVVLALSLLLALGGHTPFYKYLYHVPPFDSMRYPVKYLFIFFFMLSMVAGLGLDSLRRGVEERSGKTHAAIYVIFYSGFLFALLWGYIALFETDVHRFFDEMGFKPDRYNEIDLNLHNIKRFLQFAFLFCTALIFYLRVKRRRWVLLAIIAILGLDLFLANYKYYRYHFWDSYLRAHEFTDSLSAKKDGSRYLYSPKAAREFKFFPHDRLSLSPAYASLFKVYSVEGAEVFRTAHREFYLNLIDRAGSLEEAKRFFNILGVRYLIAPYEITDNDFRLLKKTRAAPGKDACLYEFSPFLGRFLLYGAAEFVSDDGKAKEIITGRKIDLDRVLVLKARKAGRVAYGDVKGSARAVSLQASRVAIDTETETDGFLYVADTYYPGWRAYIDGRRTKIHRADIAFRAVFVPKGHHRVVFRYVPLSFYSGLLITVMGAALCVCLVLREGRRK